MARMSKPRKQAPGAPGVDQQGHQSGAVEASPPLTDGRAVATDESGGSRPGQADELAARLEQLRALLEEDDVEGARRFIRELESRWPHSDRVRHLARTLAPPTVRLRPDIPNISRHREH